MHDNNNNKTVKQSEKIAKFKFLNVTLFCLFIAQSAAAAAAATAQVLPPLPLTLNNN